MATIQFLGTSSMVPTKARNHAGVLLIYQDETILFDCGEGTQRQFRIAGISPTKITKICITHWHGDHVLGLPGLLNTLSANNYNKTLQIYGPRGTKDYLKKTVETFASKAEIEIKAHEIGEGIFAEHKAFTLEAFPVKHSAPCLAFTFKEKDKRKIDIAVLKKYGLSNNPVIKQLQEGKDITWDGKKISAEEATSTITGKKITYITDTLYFDQLADFAKHADILISEATYDDTLLEKAVQHRHMTSTQAATIAKKAEAKKLVLTHFSQRYKKVDKLLQQAKKTFPKAEAAKDFLKLEI
ncbi:ribonuclease Z [Candidatus Woesearchaeota archaeon]|nr:ribonuclease Z [Candidatus Woesearchaeota archaeon]